jgi:hypothetical protein
MTRQVPVNRLRVLLNMTSNEIASSIHLFDCIGYLITIIIIKKE